MDYFGKTKQFGNAMCLNLYLMLNVIFVLFKYLIIFYTQISTILVDSYNEWLDNISNVTVPEVYHALETSTL